MPVGCSGRKRCVRALVDGYGSCLLVRAVILDRPGPRIDSELSRIEAAATSALVPTLVISRRCVACPREVHVAGHELVDIVCSGIAYVQLPLRDPVWDASAHLRLSQVEAALIAALARLLVCIVADAWLRCLVQLLVLLEQGAVLDDCVVAVRL